MDEVVKYDNYSRVFYKESAETSRNYTPDISVWDESTAEYQMNYDDIILDLTWSTYDTNKRNKTHSLFSTEYKFKGMYSKGCNGSRMIIIKEGKTRVLC